MLSSRNAAVNRLVGRHGDPDRGLRRTTSPPLALRREDSSLAKWSIPGQIHKMSEFHRECGLSGCESTEQAQPGRRLILEPGDACELARAAGNGVDGLITKHQCLVSLNNAI